MIQLSEGPRLVLAGIIWPDHLEPGLRAALAARIAQALSGGALSWKPDAGPDRWGRTPAHLFVSEPDGARAPFWLQAGLVEAGLAPLWPDLRDAGCRTQLRTHEAIAIRARRGYWAPRAQNARHMAIRAAPERHAGQRLAARWTVASVRPWRKLLFVNFAPSFRGAPAVALTRKQVADLTARGTNPVDWKGRRLVLRLAAGQQGLARLRIESAEHVDVER